MNIIDRFRQWLPTKRETVRVPDGCKVVVVKPSPNPTFGKIDSGLWIADLGPREYIEPGFKTVENIIKDDPKSPVVWILQNELLDYWTADALRIAELLRRFHRVQRFRVAQGCTEEEMSPFWTAGETLGPLRMSDMFGPHPQVQQSRVADVAIVAEVSSNARALMILLSSSGIPTHTPGPENEILIEMHTPNKIIVGMPGSRIQPSSEQTWHQLNLERDEIEKSPDVTAKLLEIEKRELAYVERVVRAAASKFPGSEAKKTVPLLSDLILQYAHDRDPNTYTRFIKAFLRSKVGVYSSGGIEKTSGQLVSTGESPIQLAQTTSGDGRARILVCADPPVHAMRFGEGFNSLMDGAEILKVVISVPECAGVYVSCALSKSGMLIDQETAISALKS